MEMRVWGTVSRRGTLSLVVLFLALTGIAVLAAVRSSPQEEPALPDQFPVTGIDAPESGDAAKAKLRHARSSKYDLRDKSLTQQDASRFAIKEADPPVLLELIPSHAPALQAIPAGQSDTIIVGEVISAEAHLSNDKTSVYSEFTVRVDEVIKNKSPMALFPSALISTERRGGRVRFPSGKTVLRGVYGRHMPQPQRRYVFFLEYQAEGESFPIITAYEIRNHQIFPLDGTTGTASTSNPFTAYLTYKAVAETGFINEVKCAAQGRPE
jgi:hypothetical protein